MRENEQMVSSDPDVWISVFSVVQTQYSPRRRVRSAAMGSDVTCIRVPDIVVFLGIVL